MALQKSISKFGVDFPTAYFKITGFVMNETGTSEAGKLYTGDIGMMCYTDSTKQYPLGNVQIPQRVNFLEAGGTITGMYDYVKTLPDMADATDI